MAGTITYSTLRDNICAMEGKAYADLTDAQKTRLAAWTSKAYRYAYGIMPWPEAWTVNSFSVSDGQVTGLSVDDYFYSLEVYSEDPRPASSAAYRIQINTTGPTGIWLVTTLSTVWIRYMPRPAAFTSAGGSDTLLWILQDVTALLVQSYWATSLKEEDRARKLEADALDLLNTVMFNVTVKP